MECHLHPLAACAAQRNGGAPPVAKVAASTAPYNSRLHRLRNPVHASMLALMRWMFRIHHHADSGGYLLLRILGLSPLAAVAAFSACASSATVGSARHSSDQVTYAEIASSSATNAYQLIERLRPNWLRAPSIGSIGGGARSQIIVVYLDGHRLGDLQSLNTLSVDGIRSMQWLDAARAATVLTEVGSDPIAGAIIIKTQ